MRTRFFALFAVLTACVALQGCVIIPISGLGGRSEYSEVRLRKGHFGDGKILVLDVDGVISSGPEVSGGFFGSADSTVVTIGEKLRKARGDDDIKAVVLRVDSPGGGATASDIIYRQIKQYKEAAKVPVYVAMLDVAASGGYYISMAADEVYAHPTSITGSIGVIAMFPQLHELGQKIGVSMETIKSGASKDIGAMWRPMKPEERALLQAVIDDMYEKFVTAVADGRKNLTRERIKELADGRIYTATQAKENGLIDGIMYLDEVIDHAAEKAGKKKPEVIIYRKTTSDTADSYYVHTSVPAPKASTSAAPANQFNLLNLQLDNAPGVHGEAFQYLWVP